MYLSRNSTKNLADTLERKMGSAGNLLACLGLICCFQSIFCINIITKSEWGGRAATSKSTLSSNLKYAVIHHSAGASCNTFDTCKAQLRTIQDYHMKNLDWSDIGYNFAIGDDGSIYEGRGFGVVSAHAEGWNSKSIGIMFIGDYNKNKPTSTQIAKAKELLGYAVSKGYLSSSSTLYGHRQVGSTECPGNNLFNEIKTWQNWKTL